jgi:hypothetical protein
LNSFEKINYREENLDNHSLLKYSTRLIISMAPHTDKSYHLHGRTPSIFNSVLDFDSKHACDSYNSHQIYGEKAGGL